LYFADNNKLEAIWSLFLRLLAGLIFMVCMLGNIMFIDEDEDTIVVEFMRSSLLDC
jgi:hypothetical protein